MSRKALSLLLVLLLAPAVSAGSATDPELTDPADDASPTAGDDCQFAENTAPAETCANDNAIGAATATGDAEILSVWVAEPTADAVTVFINTSAAGDDDTRYELSFNVTPTNISLYTGVEEHTVWVNLTGTTPDADAPEGTTAARNATDDSVLEVTLGLEAIDAVGGDAITHLALTVTDTEARSAGTAPAQFTRTDTTTDSTDGDSRPYNLSRPPIVPGALLEVLGATVVETVNGTETTTEFDGADALTAPGDSSDAVVTYTLRLTNTGSDPDDYTVSVPDERGAIAEAGITPTVTPETASLLPGASTDFVLTAFLNGTQTGNHSMLIRVDSDRGAFDAALAGIDVPALPPPPVVEEPPVEEEEPAERTPVPAGLSFLSPVVEGIGMDGPFGEYAELVFLAIVLLLVIIIVFLIIFLATRGAIKISIEPRSVAVAPGQTATFDVTMRNKKGQAIDAVARFEGDPHWRTGIRFGEASMDQQGVDGQLRFGAKSQDSAVRQGKLEVTVPEDVEEKESDDVTVTVARLNDRGQPVKPKKARVKVRAAAPSGPVQMAGVTHEPEDPGVGDLVTTTAILDNTEDHPLAVRVVLNVDGEDIKERSLLLPPGETTEVSFQWTVPSSSAKVRVRVFEQ